MTNYNLIPVSSPDYPFEAHPSVARRAPVSSPLFPAPPVPASPAPAIPVPPSSDPVVVASARLVAALAAVPPAVLPAVRSAVAGYVAAVVLSPALVGGGGSLWGYASPALASADAMFVPPRNDAMFWDDHHQAIGDDLIQWKDGKYAPDGVQSIDHTMYAGDGTMISQVKGWRMAA